MGTAKQILLKVKNAVLIFNSSLFSKKFLHVYTSLFAVICIISYQIFDSISKWNWNKQNIPLFIHYSMPHHLFNYSRIPNCFHYPFLKALAGLSGPVCIN